jgi:hypothetical protein
MQIQEKGIAAPSYTKLNGKYCIRAAHLNYRTVFRDFDILTKGLTMIGNKLANREALKFMQDLRVGFVSVPLPGLQVFYSF